MVMPSLEYVQWQRDREPKSGSTVASRTPREPNTPRDSCRHPETLERRGRGDAGTISRSGSPTGSARALESIFVARTVRRTPAVGSPASAMSARLGVEAVQPVTA